MIWITKWTMGGGSPGPGGQKDFLIFPLTPARFPQKREERGLMEYRRDACATGAGRQRADTWVRPYGNGGHEVRARRRLKPVGT